MQHLERTVARLAPLTGALNAYQRAAVQILLGVAGLALLTFICFHLGLNLTAVVSLYLILIVLLSLWGSFVASAVVSITAVVACDYFFTSPVLSLRMTDPFDYIALVLFLTTSFVVTTLVIGVRKRSEQLLRAERALRQTQADLARANRVMLVGEMTSAIAHEVNQPLTGVVSNAGTCSRYLGADPPNIEQARTYLALIVRDGKRAAEILGRIRALVTKVPPRKELLDVNDVIREVMAITQNQLERNSVKVRTRFASAMPLVPADRIQLQQVVLNLLINAIEAMNEVGDGPREVEVRSDRSDAHAVSVEVRDSGPGVDARDAERLFDSFFTTKPGGMGMGLSISRSIIEAHGGRLSATPNAPRGVVFHLTLPIHGDGHRA